MLYACKKIRSIRSIYLYLTIKKYIYNLNSLFFYIENFLCLFLLTFYIYFSYRNNLFEF